MAVRERPSDRHLPAHSPPGGTVAKFAAQNVHKRLVKEEAYEKKNYEEALKRAFLGTDEDLLAGETIRATHPPTQLIPLPLLDPAHVRDPSGCTAVAALITADNKIYVVRVTCACARPRPSSSPPPRQMRAIPDPSSPTRVLLSP